MAEEKDDILAETRAAFEGLSSEESVIVEPPVEAPAEPTPVETAEQKAERARDDAGRFAKEPKGKRPTLTLPKEPTEKPLAAATPTAATPTPTPQVAGEPAAPSAEKKIPAPQEWSGMEKVKWDRLPVPIQEGIVKREQERQAVLADLAPLKEQIDLNREYLIRGAGSVGEGFRQAMAFVKMYDDNPALLIQSLAQRAGVDLRALVGGQQSAPGQQQPADIQSLLAQLVDQRLQPILAQSEQQQTQQLQTTIDQFASDPKRPFFNDVRVHMGQLIQAGAAKSMEEAYEQATWANPAIRAHLMQEASEATQKAKAAEVQKATNARRASVTGSPLPGAALNGKGDPKANALDDVRAAYAELSGA